MGEVSAAEKKSRTIQQVLQFVPDDLQECMLLEMLCGPEVHKCLSAHKAGCDFMVRGQ